MTGNRQAAIYCRISRDPEGLRNGVERQEEDCRALAQRSGLTVRGVYTDNDISASTLSKKVRPAYDSMLQAARDGEVSVVIAYSNSRLTRRLADLEDLIQLHEKHGTEIKTVVSGEDNLSTADGRMVARIKASVDSAEAERTGERLRRAFEQRAQRGTTNHGGRPFGWSADKLTLDPRESQMIRNAAEDVLNGVPLRSIARDWNDQGILTARGKPWTHTTLRRLLQRPRLAGRVVHRGEVVRDEVGQPIAGQWEPIFTPDEHERLTAALDRDVKGSGHRAYELAGILRCGLCGANLHGMKRGSAGHSYTCAREGTGHTVTIQGERTDQLILDLAKRRLANEDVDAEARPDPAESADDARLQEIPTLVAELMDAFKAGDMPGTIVFPQVKQLEAEKVEIMGRRKVRLSARQLPKGVTADNLADLSVERRRAVLEALLEAVVVYPAKHRGEKWRADRLMPVWR